MSVRLSWNPCGVCAFCGESTLQLAPAAVRAGALVGDWRVEEDGELPACRRCRRRQRDHNKWADELAAMPLTPYRAVADKNRGRYANLAAEGGSLVDELLAERRTETGREPLLRPRP